MDMVSIAFNPTINKSMNDYSTHVINIRGSRSFFFMVNAGNMNFIPIFLASILNLPSFPFSTYMFICFCSKGYCVFILNRYRECILLINLDYYILSMHTLLSISCKSKFMTFLSCNEIKLIIII